MTPAWVLAATLAAAAGTDLEQFEQGALPSGWTGYGEFPAAVAPQGGRNGSGALHAKIPAGAPVKSQRSGAVRTITYDKPDRSPIYWGGWSKAAGVCSSDYGIHLDIYHPDGTATWGNVFRWSPGTHDWEFASDMIVPAKPVSRIECYVFLRRGEGEAWFDDVFLERRDPGEVALQTWRRTNRPFKDEDLLLVKRPGGTEETSVPCDDGTAAISPLKRDRHCVWAVDSMRKVTPLTFPTREDIHTSHLEFDVARRGAASAQLCVTTGRDCELTGVTVVFDELRRGDGTAFRGTVGWERVGYVPRQYDTLPHPLMPPRGELWEPEPLLPPAPMRVRRGATQGAWVTVRPAADATAGEYAGTATVKDGDGRVLGRIPMKVRVRGFAQPERFGVVTAFSLWNNFIRATYPEDAERKIAEAADIMLDHRLNPDNISRWDFPAYGLLERARKRGMNSFCVMDLKPLPKAGSPLLLVEPPPPAESFSEAAYCEITNRLAPYWDGLKRRGLAEGAYVYGFDEREKEYYAGMKAMRERLRRDFPGLSFVSTARMYRDMSESPHGIALENGLNVDVQCPREDQWDQRLTDALHAKGHRVWWYTCWEPLYPHCNNASTENPPIEGRLLMWLTRKVRADGFLYWHVNLWQHRGERVEEDDTFSPNWRAYNFLHAHGDGLFLYAGRRHILPGIRLAQVRDGVQDVEWLDLAERTLGAEAAREAQDELVASTTSFTRDPAKLLSARARLADRIEAALAKPQR